MNIGEFSNKAGITIDTLRYYNKIGLLVPIRNNNKRVYNDDDLEKAIAITKLKSLNFSLDEIKALFTLEKNIESYEKDNTRGLHELTSCLRLIENKLQDIIKQQQELLSIRLSLEKMITKTNTLIDKSTLENIP